MEQKNKLIWVSEEEQNKKLKERIDSHKEGQSRDGYIIAAEGNFSYKGIVYLIRILRYYNHTDNFTTMGSERIADKHVVVEYPEETKPIVDLVSGIEDVYDFLYHDTNHSYCDKMTTEEQIEECHKLAKSDIDSLFTGKLSKKLDNAIKKLKELKFQLNNIKSSL